MKENPFPSHDKDRHAIWQILVERDIRAFVRADWSMIAGDFIEESFMGIDAGGHKNPADWSLKYPALESYKQEWLKQAREFSRTEWGEDLEEALFRVSSLKHIEIKGDSALAHKHFTGDITKADGERVPVNWQTLYRCRKVRDRWKVAGFTGYLPHYRESASKSGKQLPEGVSQHKTAGPYSPVLVVNPGKLVVISGQAAINPDGDVVGETIEEQTASTMENCRKQLASAGCSLDDVFKVNVYLKDLDDWPRFNEVYKTYLNEPFPVRAAVQTELLLTLLVEIEMWAVKS
jgi:reactive intermediate/imine deaminase